MAFNASDYISDSVWSGAVNGTVQNVNTNANNLIDGINIQNLTAAVAYLQVFDAAAANVTVGTTAPTWYIAIPASGNVQVFTPKPIKHTTGLSLASTTTATGSSSAATSVTVFYGTSAS